MCEQKSMRCQQGTALPAKLSGDTLQTPAVELCMCCGIVAALSASLGRTGFAALAVPPCEAHHAPAACPAHSTAQGESPPPAPPGQGSPAGWVTDTMWCKACRLDSCQAQQQPSKHRVDLTDAVLERVCCILCTKRARYSS
jgi:hypothetical protein